MTLGIAEREALALAPRSLPDFDLEGTPRFPRPPSPTVPPRTRHRAATGVAMRVVGALMPRPSVVKRRIQRTYGRQRAPRRDRLVLRPVLRRRLRAPRQPSRATSRWTPTNWGDLEIDYQPVEARKGPARYRRGRCRKEHGREVSRLPAVHREQALDAPPQPMAAPTPPARICALSPSSSTASAGASSTARTRTLTSTALPSAPSVVRMPASTARA